MQKSITDRLSEISKEEKEILGGRKPLTAAFIWTAAGIAM